MALSVARLQSLADELSKKNGGDPAPKKESAPIQSKENVIDFPIEDMEAKKAGFLILSSREAYQRQLSKGHYVFLFLEGDSWYCYRVTWRGKSTPSKETAFGRNLPFKVALDHTKQYINWFQSR